MPPGPLGLVTVIPDLVGIWKTQAQMVADIAGVHGRHAELTEIHMLHCLFKHSASLLARDALIQGGGRILTQQASQQAIQKALESIGIQVAKRVIGKSTLRWVPLLGAASVAAYSYYDTIKVGRVAAKLITDIR